jgi:hypothetical protein
MSPRLPDNSFKDHVPLNHLYFSFRKSFPMFSRQCFKLYVTEYLLHFRVSGVLLSMLILFLERFPSLSFVPLFYCDLYWCQSLWRGIGRAGSMLFHPQSVIAGSKPDWDIEANRRFSLYTVISRSCVHVILNPRRRV